jgi:Tfp pilus assembly protein PilN
MAKKKPENQINLLPQEEFDASTLGRTLRWLLGTFRYIVIATEMVVMLSFLSRFWLDARSNDLIDNINQKKAIIASYSTFEDQFRVTQKQLSIFKDYTSDKLILSPTLNAITSKVPSNILLTQVTFDQSKVDIAGETTNESSLSSFVFGLGQIDALQNVNLVSVESKKSSTTLTFRINASLNERSISAK